MRIGLIAAALLVAAGWEAQQMTVPSGGLSCRVDLHEQVYDAEGHRLHIPVRISAADFGTALIDTQVYARATLSTRDAPPPALEISTGAPDPVEPFGGTFAHTGQTYQVLTGSLPLGCQAPAMDLGANRLNMTLEIDAPEGYEFGVTPIDVDVTVWRLEFIGPDEGGAWRPVRRFHSWDFRVDPTEADP